MLNITLVCTDCIETLLPMVEAAMEQGMVCRLHNIDYLSKVEVAALTLLVKADCLIDINTGKRYQAQPGFALLGIDQHGAASTLAIRYDNG